jgi:hypothetical protein
VWWLSQNVFETNYFTTGHVHPRYYQHLMVPLPTCLNVIYAMSLQWQSCFPQTLRLNDLAVWYWVCWNIRHFIARCGNVWSQTVSWIIFSLFRGVTQSRLVVSYRRFVTINLPHLEGPRRRQRWVCVLSRSALSRDITQRVMVITYRRFGTTCRSPNIDLLWIGCPETSVGTNLRCCVTYKCENLHHGESVNSCVRNDSHFGFGPNFLSLRI